MLILQAGRCRYGFSLIEIIVVLFILSLVTAVVLPTFSSFGENRLKSESREIASILRYMNDSAISRKETFVLKFDLGENRILWKGPDGEKSKRFDLLTGITSQSTGLVSKGEVTFFFEPVGARENLSVHLSREGKDMTVTLNHLSGNVKVREEGLSGILMMRRSVCELIGGKYGINIRPS